MNYEDAVRFLYSLGNEVKAAKLGLERGVGAARSAGNPHRVGDFIHVAGTNGKGSTCAMIESAPALGWDEDRPLHVAALGRAHRAHLHIRPPGEQRGFRCGVRPGA